MFSPGTKVRLKIDHSKIGIILSVVSQEPVVSYLVFHDQNSSETYFEDQIETFEENKEVQLSSPEEFLSLYASRKMKLNPATSLFSLNAGKIKFIPFQFRPLARLLKAERQRILIADEVGVGKTIETGIIIKELEKRNSMTSAVIICPKDLTAKWRREMKTRFDEAFEIMTSDRLQYCLNELEMEGVWPYECSKCIIGLEMLRREENIERFYSIEDPALFDVLVLDEAHHVINPNGKSHSILEYFCDNSETAVFLSATPLQLGSQDLFSLLNLLLPEEFMDMNVFSAMAEPNSFINAAIRNVRNVSDPEWQMNAAENLKSVTSVNEWSERTFSGNHLLSYWKERLETDSPLNNEERIACLRDLESLHTFSHVINRTKRKDIGEFTVREPVTVMTTFTDKEREFYNTAREFRFETLQYRYGERTAKLIMSTIERQITSSLHAFVQMLDQFINRGIFSLEDYTDDIDSDSDFGDIEDTSFYDMAEGLRQLAVELPESDTKTDRLLEIIDDTVHNTEAGKLLVFSFFRNTLRYLSEKIREAGYRVEVITGQTSMEDREDYRQRFRLNKSEENAIDVLLCSEVGCEGLDYEFCSRMVNFDIPWNPMKIEQRIGRIDRFGQKSPKIMIYNFITEDTVEEKIFYRCFNRLGIFNSTIGDLESVLGDIYYELTDAAFNMKLTDKQKANVAQQIIDNKIRLAEEQRKFEKESKELFLMDIENKDDEILSERENQIKLQMIMVKEFFKIKYPDSTVTEISDTQLKIRLHRADKLDMLKVLNIMKKKREADRNNQQVRLFESYLDSDNQTVVLNFDGDVSETDRTTIFVSATHPLMLMAEEVLNTDVKPFCTSVKVNGGNLIEKGTYLFGCYEWKECGYKKSEDIRIILHNTETGNNTVIKADDFEKLMLVSEMKSDTNEPDLSVLNHFIYNEKQQAKNRLEEINKDTVIRKISTLNKYYTGRIGLCEEKRRKATDPKIYRMYNGQLQKLQIAWEEKRSELEGKQNADIIVKNFASGMIEVI